MLFHGVIAARSCSDCRKWLYDDRPGCWGLKPVERPAGRKLERLPNQLTPCSSCPKIPDGAEPKPENAVELSVRNRMAYQHYLECKAVGEFPVDAIVRRNAGVIREIEDVACAGMQQGKLDAILTVVTARLRG
jgi:hypothetical protein